ncbi:hypothetical protein [Haloferula sp. BvORR071]|uniref:hypothetical protein n=1 Tax=Haloferula sp. BvORR071 TaxID=1396141 RepID=UPI00054DE43A|nr:hypothetical protein [Haloferula sp. BvORR071]
MTAHAESFGPTGPDSGDPAIVSTESSSDPTYDPFAVALAVLNGEAASESDDRPAATVPVDCFREQGDSSVSAADLADGRISSFRIGEGGSDKVSVSESGGLSVGTSAVDTHEIEITANGRIKAGTYTLIDYKGSIGGAGFAGLSLRTDPHLHAELVNNAAESKIEVIVTGTDALELASAVKSIWSTVTQSDWMLLPRLLQRPAQQVQ